MIEPQTVPEKPPHWRLKYRADEASQHLCVASLMALIQAHGWSSDEATVCAALPLRIGHFSGWDLLDALHNLGLPVRTDELDAIDLTSMDLPCLLLRADGAFGLVTGYDPDKGLQVTDPETGDKSFIGTGNGLGSLISIAHADRSELLKQPEETRELLSDLMPQLWPLFLASMLINILGLATPIFVMTIYNTAIPAKSYEFVIALSAGVAIVYATELLIRRARSAAIVHMAAGLENRLGLRLLHKLVKLPLATALRSDALQQRARLRQFESMRDAMAGPLVQAILDLPFIALFVTVLFLISPSIGWVTLGFVCVNALSFAIIGPLQRRREIKASDALTSARKLVLQSVTAQPAIRDAATQDIWKNRLRDQMAAARDAEARLRGFSRSAQVILQGFLTIAGLSAGFIAVAQVIAGELSLGVLIAVLILVWRVMAPIQALSLVAVQAQTIWSATSTIDTVLKIPEENHRGIAPKSRPEITGDIQFEQVSFRYPDAHLPALAGVSFAAKQGEIVILSGNAMSGKSTAMELIAGLRRPLSGRIMINGEDTRQIPSDDLRAAMGICLQQPYFLHGTIRQNLEIAMPLASEEACWVALGQAGIADWVAAMPDHIETLLSKDAVMKLPLPLKRGISLAMALIRYPKIYLLDQPTTGLDPAHAAHIRAQIKSLRATSTVIMAAQSPEDIALGDRFVILERGRVIASETGSRGRERAIALMKPRELEKVA